MMALALAVSAACTPSAINLPTGPGDPYPEYAAALERATSECRNIRTLSAELSLSGTSGRRRLRARVLSAFERPAAIRLEGLAPFGAPGFILAANTREVVLLLPRDGRVLRGEPVEGVIEALTGLRLDADALKALLTGCVVADPRASAGVRYGNAWIAIELGGSAAVYLKPAAPELVAAGRVGTISVQYDKHLGGLPRVVRLRSTPGPGGGVESDLTIAVSQLETNTTLEDEVFSVNVPDDVLPLTLDELRQAGPLGESSS